MFADLGLGDERLVKVQAAHAIDTEILERRELLEDEGGELVGFAQPDQFRIAAGRSTRVWARRLIKAALHHLGRDVEIIFTATSRPVGELRFRNSCDERPTP